MEKFERLDFEGPKKEFIKSNIQFVLDQSSSELKNEYVPQISHNQDNKYSHNKYIKLFFRVILKNDPDKIDNFTKRMISILDRYPSLKKWMKARLMPKPQEKKLIISLQHLLNLDVNNFIRKLYIEMLGREADNEGFNSWQKAICSSMPKEAVLYAISKTEEFGNRFEIEDLKNYKKIYTKYKIKNAIKKIPIIGFLIKVVITPSRIEQLVVSQSIRNENLTYKFNQLFDSTIHRINEIQAFNYQFLCDYIKNNDINSKNNFESMLKRIDISRDENNENINMAVKKLDDAVNNIYDSLIQRLSEMQINNERFCTSVTSSNNSIEEKLSHIKNDFEANSNKFEAYSNDLKVYSNDLKANIEDINEKENLIGTNIKALFKNVETYNLSVCNRLDLFGRQKPCRPVFDPQYELHILKKSNISLLEKLVLPPSNSRNTVKVVAVGHYAKEVFEEISGAMEMRFLKPATLESAVWLRNTNEITMVAPEYIHQVIEKTDKIIILNPAVATILIIEDMINELALKVKDELILCFDTNAGNDISVVWGSGFSGIEQSANGEYHRWFQGAFNAGTIHIFNNTVYNQKCFVNFSICALDNKSQMILFADNEKYSYRLEDEFIQVTLELNLKPGVNDILMEYFGKTIQPDKDPRFLKFVIRGLKITSREDNVQQFSVSGSIAYKNQDKVGVFSQNPSDELIRTTLHTNGFFEVESLLCAQSNDRLISNGLSRYCEANQAYEFLQPQQLQLQSESIAIYIARRKGSYINDIK